MTKSMMVAAVLAVVAVAGPALAHGKRGGEYHDLRRDHMIKKFDQDGDGRLSRAERTAAVQAVFKAADTAMTAMAMGLSRAPTAFAAGSIASFQ